MRTPPQLEGHVIEGVIGRGSVWVASGPNNEVERFDAQTRGRAGDPIEVGDDPADIDVGKKTAYTANQGDSTVSRILPPGS